MITITQILDLTAFHYGITVRGLKGRDTSKKLCEARTVAFMLMSNHLPKSSVTERMEALNKSFTMSFHYRANFKKKKEVYQVGYNQISSRIKLLS